MRETAVQLSTNWRRIHCKFGLKKNFQISEVVKNRKKRAHCINGLGCLPEHASDIRLWNESNVGRLSDVTSPVTEGLKCCLYANRASPSCWMRIARTAPVRWVATYFWITVRTLSYAKTRASQNSRLTRCFSHNIFAKNCVPQTPSAIYKGHVQGTNAKRLMSCLQKPPRWRSKLKVIQTATQALLLHLHLLSGTGNGDIRIHGSRDYIREKGRVQCGCLLIGHYHVVRSLIWFLFMVLSLLRSLSFRQQLPHMCTSYWVPNTARHQSEV